MSDLKPVVDIPKTGSPITGDGSVRRKPARIAGIETLDGLDTGEPSAIPDAQPRMIKRATPGVKVTSAGQVISSGPQKPSRPLTQQERDILSRRSNFRRR